MGVTPRYTQNSRSTSSLELQHLWECVGVFIHPHCVLDTRRLLSFVLPEPAIDPLSTEVFKACRHSIMMPEMATENTETRQE